MISKLAKFIKGYTKETILSPVFIIGEVGMEVTIPIIMAALIDNGVQQSNFRYVVISGALMIAMSLISLLFGILSARYCAIAGAGFAKNLRRGMYYNIQNFSFANIDNFSTSSLITRLTTDVTQIQQAFQMLIRICMRAPIMLISALILAISINAELSLVFVVAIPILLVALLLIMRFAMPSFRQMFKKYDKLNSAVQENLVGIRVVKAFVREEHETEKFKDASSDLLKYSKRAEKIIAFNNPIMQFVVYGCIIAVSWFGGAIINRGEMTSGELTSFLTYIMQILMSLMMVGMVLVMLSMARTALVRVNEVLSTTSNLTDPAEPIAEVANGDIEFVNVDFSYTNDPNKLVMKNLNFKINSGETIGIIGGTGSGKTSLVQLVPRLYDATNGQVLVGGNDVRNYDVETLRTAVAMVLQKNVLFSGTIKDNLRWGNKDATDEEIIEACKNAQAHDFIMSFPNGYETDLGQGGVNVSGGQKQRLCIARALLKNPKIIILDDSTSAVDTKTDAMIRKAFRTKLGDVTKIIIAQRIASVEDADKIIVLNDGEIIDFGSHDELMMKSEIYRDIYTSQKKGVATKNE